VFREKKLGSWVDSIRDQTALPLRLELWNGQQVDFDRHAPKVTIRVPKVSALGYLLQPSLFNLGKAYVEGEIEVEGKANDSLSVGNAVTRYSQKREGKLARITPGKRDEAAIRYNYDVSNDFYRMWLDENMVYSCGYFDEGTDKLGAAQLKKIDHILTKIQLRPGHTLLDIGCGWGALALRAAEKFGAHCVGITLSQNQFELARERVARAGLGNRVTIRLEVFDVENLRRHYAKTCCIWADNFEEHAAEIRTLVGDRRFRIWRVYLAGCSYAFTQDWVSLYQVVCTKAGRAPSGLPWSRRSMYSH